MSLPFAPACRPSAERGFTLVELMVIVAVIGIVSAIGFSSMASFLQEQRLRQASLELASHLQSARSRAQREGGFCQLAVSGTTVSPTAASGNVCATAPALGSLDLAAVWGASGLVVSGSTSSPLSFSRYGALASETSGTGLLPMPRVLYLGANGTSVQRCVFLDLLSIRVGWRNGSSGTCTYSNG